MHAQTAEPSSIDHPADGPHALTRAGAARFPMKRYPWRRYWARMLDAFLAVMVVGVLALAFDPAFVAGAESTGWGLKLLALILWIPAEALLLARFGTTPGKAFFRIRVTSIDGARLSCRRALGRSLRVWSLGMAFGLPVLSHLSAGFAAWRLQRSGSTWWDAYAFSTLHYRPIGAMRWVLLGGWVLAVLLLGYFGDAV